MRSRCTAIAAIILLLIIIPATQNYDNHVTFLESMRVADDGAPPVISLLSPANGSVVKPFSLIDIDVTDNVAISHVLYHWDLIANETFDAPYDLFARTSEIGHYLYVYANDTSDTWTKTVFYFISDSTYPEIDLTTPTNNSVQLSSTDVNVTVTDIHLTDVYYTWDDLENLNIWTAPYSTQLISGDGPHTLHVYANDSAGNAIEENFVFIVDDDPPIITLRDLINGTARQSDSIVDVDVIDASTMTVLYRWDSDAHNTTWLEPFHTTIPDGDSLHTLTVYANDSFSRSKTVTFEFIGDNTIPEIQLNSPADGTLHRSGTEVSISVTDTHLNSVYYNWDDLGDQLWTGTITIPSGDGTHILQVRAHDSAENMALVTYQFRVDDSPPVINHVPYSQILLGYTNFTLNWYAVDANPGSYIVLINGSQVDSGLWVDSVSVTVPHVGDIKAWYNCTIILSDSLGNVIVNSTIVEIDVWPAEEFGSLIPLFVIGGITLVAGVLILIILKKEGVILSKRPN